jgi:hypothetical protein
MVPLLVTLKVTMPAGADVALSAITNSVSVAVMAVPDGDAAASDGDGVVPVGDAVAPGDEAVELHAASTTTSPIDAIKVAWLLFMGIASAIRCRARQRHHDLQITFVVRPPQANGPNGTFMRAKRPVAACRRLTAMRELAPEVSIQL